MKLKPFKAVPLWGCVFICFLSFFPSELCSQTPDSIQSQYFRARKLLGEEEYDQAILAFQQIIDSHPEFGKAYGRIAKAYISTNDLQGGQLYFEKLLSENSNNAYAYYGLAQINLEKEEYDQAIENLKKCIKLDPAFAEAYGLYGGYGGLAVVYDAKDDLDSAIQFFEELNQSDSNNALAYYGLASCYIKKFEWDEALHRLDQAVRLDPQLKPAYIAMAACYYFTGQYQKIITPSEELRKLAKATNDLEVMVYADIYTGHAHLFMGDYWKALQHYNESLKNAKESGNKEGEGIALSNVAMVYFELGQTTNALEYFETSRSFAKAVGYQYGQVAALINIGVAYLVLGKNQQAMQSNREALELARKYHYKNEEVLVLANMAEAYWEEFADYERSYDFYQQALRIASDIEDKPREGQIFLGLGDLSDHSGKYSEAVAYYNQALKVGSEIQEALTIWLAHSALGNVFKNHNQSEKAIHHYAAAIALYDSVRARLGVKSLGVSFLEDKYRDFPAIVQLLAGRERVREAFDYVEKYKAKTLLDVLAQGQTRLEALLPDTLRAQLDNLQKRLEEAHAELSRLSSQDKKDRSKLISLEQQVTDLVLQKAVLMEQVKKDFGAFYQLTASEPLSVEEVQSRVLEEGQALIEYLVGDKKLSVFVITADSLFYESINISNDSLKQMLGDLSPIFRQEKAPDEESREQIFSPQLAGFSIPRAYALYNAIIKPLESSLPGIEELIIVPDDILFYLPFEMLVYDTSTAETPYDFANAKYLLEKYPVSYASSASLLDPGLQSQRDARNDILAFGNPDFGAPAEEAETMELLAANLRYGGGVVRGGSLVSLPYSETEVKAIGEEFGGTVFTGNEATEENFKAKAKEHRILHFATHFLTDDNHPLYSKIVLAQNNRGEEDGYLQTYEVFNLKLNADLAVLSACNTGLGKLQRGEGLVGVSRAFLYAGVPSLVVSLWSINDESTSMIMKNFYRHLSEGVNKKQALRLAKIDYLKSSQNTGKDPFYWAPYILIGDWSPVQLSARASLSRWMIFLVVLILALLAVFFIRKRRSLAQQ